MTNSDNWISTTGRALGGPTAVLDLDGVISDASHRQHFLASEHPTSKDFSDFFHACVNDPVLPAGRALAEALAEQLCVVILTARIYAIRDQTVDWLARHSIRHDWLILRAANDHGPSSEWKQSQLNRLTSEGADIQLAADDDPRNVSMMRGLELPALYIASGYYDRRDAKDAEYR